MQAELDNETRPIIRNRRGVIWCPFCDMSSVLTGDLLRCPGCFAVFKDEAAEVAPASPRRRRAVATVDETATPATSSEDEEPAEE